MDVIAQSHSGGIERLRGSSLARSCSPLPATNNVPRSWPWSDVPFGVIYTTVLTYCIHLYCIDPYLYSFTCTLYSQPRGVTWYARLTCRLYPTHRNTIQPCRAHSRQTPQ